MSNVPVSGLYNKPGVRSGTVRAINIHIVSEGLYMNVETGKKEKIKKDGQYLVHMPDADYRGFNTLPYYDVTVECPGFSFDLGFLGEPDALAAGVTTAAKGPKDGKDTYSKKAFPNGPIIMTVKALAEPKENERGEVVITIPAVIISETNVNA